MDTAALTAPVLIGTTASGSEWYAYPDRHNLQDVASMVDRIGRFGGTPTDEALRLLGRPSGQPKVITVKITATQADRLHLLLPESLLGLGELATRIKGTRDQLETALDYLDPDAAWEFAQADVWTDDWTMAEFAERSVRRSVANLRSKIVSAIRSH